MFFKIGDEKTRMLRALFGSREALREIVGLARVFQRILRRDEPPDGIELERFQGCEGNRQMTGMGRIERAAEQADAATCGFWSGMAVRRGHGQTRVADI